MKELLAVRKEKKSKKPDFKHQDSWKRKRLPKKWRKPKGMHSKMRLKRKGNPKITSQGYRSPKKVRGFDVSGAKTLLVKSLKSLESITSETIMIASSLGTKKRIEIVKKALEKKIKIANLNPQEYLKNSLEEYESRISKSKEKKALKQEKQKSESRDENASEEESKDDPENKEVPENENVPEEQQEKEKQDREKILTKPK